MPLGTGHGVEGCDNVQTAVASQHQLMSAHDVPNDPGDRDGLSPRALQATDVLGRPGAAVADVGDYHGAAVKTCRDAGLTPDVARPMPAANRQLGLFSQDDFTSDGGSDTDQWPAGAQLTCRWATVERGWHLRDDATPAGNTCPLKPPCTRPPGGRRLTRGVEEPLVDELEPQVRRRPEVMTPRKPLGAHPFGTMTRWGDAGSCLMRGLEKGRTEVSGTVLAYNRRRVLPLVARPRLIAALG